MFDAIAWRYDRLNHLLSLGVDRSWRRKVVRRVKALGARRILDVATGTGDLAMMMAQACPASTIDGIDFSEQMLSIGRQKVERAGLQHRISLSEGDAEALTARTDCYDAVTVAFGVRNFEHLECGLREMCRVLKPGGRVVILEFSTPDRFPMKQLYRFYFKCILPRVGGLISGDRGAYEYLPASVFAFPQGDHFLEIMRSCGFRDVRRLPLTFGIATLYTGEK